MIEWYKDDEVGVFFSDIPNVDVFYPAPYFDDENSKKFTLKPFVIKNNLDVLLMNYISDDVYEFTINADYRWDGASIPRIFWGLIGAKTDPKFLIPSLIHDVLCENHNYVDNDRYFSTIVFERLLYVSKVNPFNRWLIKHFVDNYQKFCRW